MYIVDFFSFPAFERNLFSACLQRENLQWGKKVNGGVHATLANYGTRSGKLEVIPAFPFSCLSFTFSFWWLKALLCTLNQLWWKQQLMEFLIKVTVVRIITSREVRPSVLIACHFSSIHYFWKTTALFCFTVSVRKEKLPNGDGRLRPRLSIAWGKCCHLKTLAQ